jgi:hypothetical protein
VWEAGLKMNTTLQAVLEQLKGAKKGHENQQRQTGGLLRRRIKRLQGQSRMTEPCNKCCQG